MGKRRSAVIGFAVAVALMGSAAVLGCRSDAFEEKEVEGIELVAISLGRNGQMTALPFIRPVGGGRCTPVRWPVRLEPKEGGAAVSEFCDQNGWSVARRFSTGRHLIVFLPAHWEIAGGRWAGAAVQIRAILSDIVEAPSLLPSDVRLWRQFPAEVVVDFEDSAEEAAAEQNLRSAIVAAIDHINQAAGFKVFREARSGEPLHDRDGVYIFVNKQLDEQLGATYLSTSRCAHQPGPRFFCYPKWIERAAVHLDPEVGAPEIEHELLHAIGLRHTCIVQSVMATEMTPSELHWCGVARTRLGVDEPLHLERRLSLYDVAAIHIIREAAAKVEDALADSFSWIVAPS